MDANHAAGLLLLLFAGHALGDYPLQGTFLALGKNRHAEQGRERWPQLLAAHSLIHAGLVCTVTYPFAPAAAPWLGWAEFAIHAWTDWRKCEGAISFNRDQAIHYVHKVLWWAVALLATGAIQ